MTSAKLLVMAAVRPVSVRGAVIPTTSTQAPAAAGSPWRPPPTTYVVPPRPAADHRLHAAPARVTYAPAATTPPAGVSGLPRRVRFPL